MQTTNAPRLSKSAGFLVGVVSGLTLAVLMVALRFALGTQVIAEVMADWLTKLLPPKIFDYLLDTLQFNASRLLFGGIFVGLLVVAGGIGVLYVRFAPRPRSFAERVRQATWITAALFAVLAAVVTPVMGAGAFGRSLPDSATAYSLALLLSLVGFSLSITEFSGLMLSRGDLKSEGYNAGRRIFMRRAAVFTAVVVVGGFALRSIASNLGNLTPSGSKRVHGALSTAITPNDEFYVVARSAVVPELLAAEWELRVDTERDNPFVLTYSELLALPAVEEVVTLTCISNTVGGDLISTALWKGVPLRTILELAELPEGTDRLGFYARDGYFDSFPMDIAIREDVIIAYEMNGVPLPPAHGFPARIIVPGLYGMEHVKWLWRIEPVSSSFRGYWQQRGWADTAVIKTLSRIDVPSDREVIAPGPAIVGGVAFAGTRGIVKVEVSLDDGLSWREAEFDDALSPYSWVIWTHEWSDPAVGAYDMLVRATDGTGALQTEKRKTNLPAGPDGYHEILVRVREPVPQPSAS